ncbi:KilA-N domain-containing protein [Alphaentomopoxvirus acuprea]|uniref:KilA-N domain-containing protein n=1 Tax=Alphaentomopoxvirus acuprea TaxID=62099 RepID=W6JIY0_9POXV|nr:KilA-N domain-containing protein [Anomala cuprea entomopoxvirus]BAO49563.1 KilA-N domain-containing protein [Anomala cuprea entomopoxvirus]
MILFDFHGKNEKDKLISGTYVHSKLILNIASWISRDFYDKCSDIINTYFINYYLKEYQNQKNKLENKINEYDKLVNEKKNCITNLENSIKELNISNNQLNNTLQNVKSKIINDPFTQEKFNTFTIIKLNIDNPEENYNYYISTVCERDYDKRISNLRSEYPNMEIILSLNKIPNSKYLFDRIKNELAIHIDYHINFIDLIPKKKKKNWLREDEFLRKIMEIKEDLNI